MKKYLQKPAVRKALYVLGGIIVFLLILDNILLPWYVSSSETSVPNVVGMREEQAITTIKDADLDAIVSDTTFDEKVPKGSIVVQKPKAGEVVKEGRRVYIFISGGGPTVQVPMLKGKSIRDAKFALERLGLKLGNVQEAASSNPRDMIFDQQFASGTPLKKGESVGVTISIGTEQEGGITVPDLIGKSLSEAEKILADSSLRVGKINYQKSFSLLPNTILDQYPSKGNKANQGDAVDLFVTKTEDSAGSEIIEQ